MIKSFKHKGLKKFFETGNVQGIQPSHSKKLRIRLTLLNTASSLKDIDLANLNLHQLHGDRKDIWAIDVSGNWRITFIFEDGDFHIVNYEDYH